MVKVLFVCLGNICRSPLAEGLFKSKVKEEGLEDVILVDSCGTSNYHIGEQPDSRTRKNALENGIELDHQARQFQVADFDRFDQILVMDRSNLANVKDVMPSAKYEPKLHLMRDFEPNAEEKGADVPDPYFGGEKGFQKVYDILDRSTSNLIHVLKKEYQL